MIGPNGRAPKTGVPERVTDGAGPNAAVRTYRHTDPTTSSDRCRIREARAAVRTAMTEASHSDEAASQRIFRQEIGTNVRSVSPFAVSFATWQGTTIDMLVDRIAPAPGWPRSPPLSARPANRFRRMREPYQRFVIGTPSGDQEAIRLRGFGHGAMIMRSRADWACIEVIDHSVELEVRIGPARLETLFGVLRIELDDVIPATLAAACVGRPIGEVGDHPALRGHRWPIVSIEEPLTPTLGPTLVVETGSVAFRMPWMR